MMTIPTPYPRWKEKKYLKLENMNTNYLGKGGGVAFLTKIFTQDKSW